MASTPTWMNQIFTFLGLAQYSTAPTPAVDGSSTPLLSDQYGRLLVVPQPPGSSPSGGGAHSQYSPGGLQKSGVIKASAGTLYSVFGSNEGGGSVWVMLFNTTSVPSNGTVPTIQFPVPSGQPFSLSQTWTFSTGITYAFSSTAASLTLVSSNIGWLNSEYGG